MPKQGGDTLRVAINGFGRIGSAVVRALLMEDHPNLQLVAINDHGDIEGVRNVLQFDSMYGTFPQPVRVQGKRLKIGENSIRVFNQDSPDKLPWKELAVDIVIESTGAFATEEGARKHIRAGASQVLISTIQKKGRAELVVAGHKELQNPAAQIISHASCTTSAIAPVMAMLQEAYKIEAWNLFAVQSVTGTQNIIDKTSGRRRRSRSAIGNIIPIEVNPPIAIPKLFEGGAGKFSGQGVRVPTQVVHIAVLSVVLKKDVTSGAVNQSLRNFSREPRWKDIVTTTSDPVVSQDLRQASESAVVDLGMTRVAGGRLVQLGVWYDNVWAFSQRLIDVLDTISHSHGQ